MNVGDAHMTQKKNFVHIHISRWPYSLLWFLLELLLCIDDGCAILTFNRPRSQQYSYIAWFIWIYITYFARLLNIFNNWFCWIIQTNWYALVCGKVKPSNCTIRWCRILFYGIKMVIIFGSLDREIPISFYWVRGFIRANFSSSGFENSARKSRISASKVLFSIILRHQYISIWFDELICSFA